MNLNIERIINPPHIELTNAERFRLTPRFTYLLSYILVVLAAAWSLATASNAGMALQSITYFIALFAMLRACSLAKHSQHTFLAFLIWVGFAVALLGGAL